MNRCYWCDEPRHRSDLLIVDDKFMCARDTTDCIQEYTQATLPSARTVQKQETAEQ